MLGARSPLRQARPQPTAQPASPTHLRHQRVRQVEPPGGVVGAELGALLQHLLGTPVGARLPVQLHQAHQNWRGKGGWGRCMSVCATRKDTQVSRRPCGML